MKGVPNCWPLDCSGPWAGGTRRGWFGVRAAAAPAAAPAAEERRRTRPVLPTLEEFFPEIQGDLSGVVWAHAVDSQKELTKALKGNLT